MTMSWQQRLRELGDRLAAGEITTDDYRRESEGLLAEADAEVAASTRPTTADVLVPVEVLAPADEPAKHEPPKEDPKKKVPIPASAAWEAPSGEMTQIVGTEDRTTVVPPTIADKLGEADDPAT